MRKSLVAFDTNHIKSYVFGTDRLKEIRGASALLDKLNREDMREIAEEHCKEKKIKYSTIYANGGSGLFLLMTDEKTAEDFGRHVQHVYQKKTAHGSSIAYVVQKLPEDLPDDIEELKKSAHKSIEEAFELIRYGMRETKDNPPSVDIISLSSHPFMRPCDSCGTNYAERKGADQDDPDEQGHYCAICYQKQRKDQIIKSSIEGKVKGGDVSSYLKGKNVTKQNIEEKELWDRILFHLNELDDDTRKIYDFKLTQTNKLPNRPNDFNVFRNFAHGREYLGLIYADANNMGVKLEKLKTLQEYETFANEVDQAIHIAMSRSIKEHLPVKLIVSKEDNTSVSLYPFDILLLGGDDIVMVTDASKAMDVAYTIAREFHAITQKSTKIKEELKPCTLSIGVVLAPVKYPFSLLWDMADKTLKAAKKESSKIRARAKGKTNDSCINFVVVTGGSIKDFDSVDKNYKSTDGKNNDFHATLRPYDLDSLELLLNAIKEGHRRNLGRTKLHALREAIVQKNLTTSVSNGLAVLRNWRKEQRTFAMTALYEFGGRYTTVVPATNIKDPVNGFPSVTFPWFVDQQESKEKERKDKAAGKAEGKVYRTTFLDFVELFDFVASGTDTREEERA